MSNLFNWLCHTLFQGLGYITGFFSMLYNCFIQLFVYIGISIIQYIGWFVSHIVIFFLLCFDYFLQFVVYVLQITIGGDAFGVVGLSTSTIENNLTAILALAPFAKMLGYVLNLDAMNNAFQCFLAFLILWTVYRWFRVWVRG